MAVRLFVGNLVVQHHRSRPAHLLRRGRAAVAGRAAGRSGNRPPARLRVRRVPRSRARRAGDSAIQRTAVQRTAARGQRSARARGSRARRPPRRAAIRPGRDRPAAASAPAAGRSFGGAPRPFDPAQSAPGGAAARSRNFGPDAKPQRGGSAKGKKKDDDKPRGPIPLKNTGRSFSLDERLARRGDAGDRRFRDEQAGGRTDDDDEG